MSTDLYVEYIYHRAVCNKTMPPSVPVIGRTVFTISLLVSFVPTSCDRQYPTATISAISIAPRPSTSVDPFAVASIYFAIRPLGSFGSEILAVDPANVAGIAENTYTVSTKSSVNAIGSTIE